MFYIISLYISFFSAAQVGSIIIILGWLKACCFLSFLLLLDTFISQAHFCLFGILPETPTNRRTTKMSSSQEDTMIEPLPPLESEKHAPQEEAIPEFKPTRGFVLAFVSICMITLAAALDATSLSIALPIITVKLKGTAIEAFWSGTSFLVTSAVFQPVIAGLSHVFGRKELVLASSLFFAVGSLIAALATNFTMMLVGRSLQWVISSWYNRKIQTLNFVLRGVGGGGILTLGEIIVTDLVPLSVRGAWFGYLGSMWAIGSVTGPLMGGAFAQNVSWTWIFWYVNVSVIYCKEKLCQREEADFVGS